MYSFTSCTDDGYFFSAEEDEIIVDLNAPSAAIVHGGVPPYVWSLTGNAFKVYAWRTHTGDNKVSVTTRWEAGESVEELTVKDKCGSEVSITVVSCARTSCCDSPDYANPDMTIDSYRDGDTTITATLTGGCPPFHWTAADPRVGLINRFTNLRENTLTRADGFYIDPVMYISDTCGNVCGNADDYSFYFPFSSSYNDIVMRSTQTVYGTTPVSSPSYTTFPLTWTGASYIPSMVELTDSDYYSPGGEDTQLHFEFYLHGGAETVAPYSCTHWIYRQYKSGVSGEVRLFIGYDASTFTRSIYFEANGTYPALSMLSAVSGIAPLDLFGHWFELDIVRTYSDGGLHNKNSIYLDGVELVTVADRVWTNMAAPIRIGDYGAAANSTLRLRNCFFIKGTILL